MEQFAYRAADAAGEFYSGPEPAPDAESVVLKARERGHRVIQVFCQASPGSTFNDLLSYPAISQPPGLACSRWRLFERRAEPGFESGQYRQLLALVNQGELKATLEHFPPRLLLDTGSLLARAERVLQERFAQAFETGLASASRDGCEPNQSAPDGKLAGQVARSIEDRGENDLRAQLCALLGEEAAALVVVDPPRPVVQVKTREGSTLTVPKPEADELWTSRGFDIVYAGGCTGDVRSAPAAKLAELFIEESVRRGASGVRASASPSAGNREFRLEMLLQDELRPIEPGPPQMIFGLFRDYLSAMGGISPLTIPPAEREMSALIAGARFAIRSRISLTSSGEAIRIDWEQT